MTAETTPDELEILIRKAGLENLPAAYRAELLDAYRHLEKMAARIDHARPYADEPAHVFVPATFAPKGA